MDPIETLKVAKDTSLALIDAAQRRGWDVSYFQQGDMYLEGDRVYADVPPLKIDLDGDPWFELAATQRVALDSLDVVLMRKDPPFDMDYVYSTYLLERAAQRGTLVVNNPRSLRDCKEFLIAVS